MLEKYNVKYVQYLARHVLVAMIQYEGTTMSIFSKVTDIVNSNLNSIVDRSKDPMKISRMMIQEIEDTIIENKSRLAQDMMDDKKILRKIEALQQTVVEYEDKASLAIEKGKEGLAKRIVDQSIVFDTEIQVLEKQRDELDQKQAEMKSSIVQMEVKLREAKDRANELRRKSEVTSTSKEENGLKPIDDKLERIDRELDDYGEDKGLGSQHNAASLEEEMKALEHEALAEEKLARLKMKKK